MSTIAEGLVNVLSFLDKFVWTVIEHGVQLNFKKERNCRGNELHFV